ncbi:hypothetical protein KR009_005632 [Drosophila setifemur]|nr:hypothetical protein KR009_005632 [Drosophila setifemur]
MPRPKKSDRKKSEREEKLRLAQIKIDTALEKVDEIAKRCKHEVDMQIKLIRARTDKQLLEMNFTEFMELQLDHFSDYHHAVPKIHLTRSHSIDRQRGRTRTPQHPQFPREQVQSVDRMLRSRGEKSSTTFKRYARDGEQVLSKAGSPLAVHVQRGSDVHIPTRKGVIIVKPHELGQVKREVLMNLDENALMQMKTLKTNLGVLLEMATKLGKH